MNKMKLDALTGRIESRLKGCSNEEHRTDSINSRRK
jgi:hypothetical protein